MSVYAAILPTNGRAQVSEQAVHCKDGEGAQREVLEPRQNGEILSTRYEKSEVSHAAWHKVSEPKLNENVMLLSGGSSSGDGK